MVTVWATRVTFRFSSFRISRLRSRNAFLISVFWEFSSFWMWVMSLVMLVCLML